MAERVEKRRVAVTINGVSYWQHQVKLGGDWYDDYLERR